MQADVNVWDRVWTWKHKSLKDKGIKWLGLSKGMSHLSYLEEVSVSSDGVSIRWTFPFLLT